MTSLEAVQALARSLAAFEHVSLGLFEGQALLINGVGSGASPVIVSIAALPGTPLMSIPKTM